MSNDDDTMSNDDDITEPSHYTVYLLEPITFIMLNDMEFWRGNIIKYASRAGYKQYDGLSMQESTVKDLKKVIRYAEMQINFQHNNTQMFEALGEMEKL